MRAVVFVSKTTGFDCLKWLLSACPEDQYTIFVGEPDKRMILDYLDSSFGEKVTEGNLFFYDLASVDPTMIINDESFDWLINIWGSYIFRSSLLSRVKHSINLHPSFLPYGRGRDPVVWAIRDRAPAGATLHEITEEIDAGAIWVQTEVPYGFPVTGEKLYAQVERAAVKLFIAEWQNIRGGKVVSRPQGRPDLPTRKRKDLLEDRMLAGIDHDVILKILAHDFRSSEYTALLKSDGKTYALTLAVEEIK